MRWALQDAARVRLVEQQDNTSGHLPAPRHQQGPATAQHCRLNLCSCTLPETFVTTCNSMASPKGLASGSNKVVQCQLELRADMMVE